LLARNIIQENLECNRRSSWAGMAGFEAEAWRGIEMEEVELGLQKKTSAPAAGLMTAFLENMS
jgi:hypothetical protein